MAMSQPKLNFTYATSDLAKSALISENGVMIGYTAVLPNFTTAATAVLTILDDDGYTVYTGSSKSKNATSVTMGLTIPMGIGYTATLTLNDVAGGAFTAVIKLYVEYAR
jgi:hypothetical protein